jgi:hypothetical protein
MEQYSPIGGRSAESPESLRIALARRQAEKDRLERRIELLHEQIYLLIDRLPVADQDRLGADPALGELARIWKIGHRRARRAAKEREEHSEAAG